MTYKIWAGRKIDSCFISALPHILPAFSDTDQHTLIFKVLSLGSFFKLLLFPKTSFVRIRGPSQKHLAHT